MDREAAQAAGVGSEGRAARWAEMAALAEMAGVTVGAVSQVVEAMAVGQS